jgi:hypothetical protein
LLRPWFAERSEWNDRGSLSVAKRIKEWSARREFVSDAIFCRSVTSNPRLSLDRQPLTGQQDIYCVNTYQKMVTTMSSADHENEDEELELDAVESVETYETAGDIVFYDVKNPLAWVKTSYTVSLPDQI